MPLKPAAKHSNEVEDATTPPMNITTTPGDGEDLPVFNGDVQERVAPARVLSHVPVTLPPEHVFQPGIGSPVHVPVLFVQPPARCETVCVVRRKWSSSKQASTFTARFTPWSLVFNRLQQAFRS